MRWSWGTEGIATNKTNLGALTCLVWWNQIEILERSGEVGKTAYVGSISALAHGSEMTGDLRQGNCRRGYAPQYQYE